MKRLAAILALLSALMFIGPRTALSAPAPLPKRETGDGALLGDWTECGPLSVNGYGRSRPVQGSEWSARFAYGYDITNLDNDPPPFEFFLKRSPYSMSGTVTGTFVDDDAYSLEGSWKLEKQILGWWPTDPRPRTLLMIAFDAFDPETLNLAAQFLEMEVLDVLEITYKVDKPNAVQQTIKLCRPDMESSFGQ